MPRLKTSKYNPNTPAASPRPVAAGPMIIASCISDTWAGKEANAHSPNGLPQLGTWYNVRRVVTPSDPDYSQMWNFWHDSGVANLEGTNTKDILILDDMPSLEYPMVDNPLYEDGDDPERDDIQDAFISGDELIEVGWPGRAFDYPGKNICQD